MNKTVITTMLASVALVLSAQARPAAPIKQSAATTYVSNVPVTPWWAHRYTDQVCVPAREVAANYPYHSSPAEHVEALRSQSLHDRATIQEKGDDEVDVIVVQLRAQYHIYANNYGDRQGTTSALSPTSETFRYFRTKDACDAERHQLDHYR